MKDYTYNEKDIECIKHLIVNTPHKIWWNYVSYIFDYSTYYIQLECNSVAADSQNDSDEAIISIITYVMGNFVKTEYEELICENKRIERAYISRTFLYFTSHHDYSNVEKFIRLYWFKLKSFLKNNANPIDKILSNTTGGHTEICCRPSSDEAKKVNNKYANLIDKGLLLEIESVCLPAYLKHNGYGFPTWNNKYFHLAEELKQDFINADFIEVQV